MKKLVLALLLSSAASLYAAAPTSSSYPVQVHVVFSRAVSTVAGFPGGSSYQQLEALIDGQRVELTCSAAGVLALGDYNARVSTHIKSPKKAHDYDLYKGYDFLMPDGQVRTYQVTAMGQAEFPAPPPPYIPPTPPDNTPAPTPTPTPTPPPMPTPNLIP